MGINQVTSTLTGARKIIIRSETQAQAGSKSEVAVGERQLRRGRESREPSTCLRLAEAGKTGTNGRKRRRC